PVTEWGMIDQARAFGGPAHKKWRKLDGQSRLPEIIQGIEFRDGIRHVQAAA
ncbi:MAG: IS256 family transposase, partial [Rhodobacterales bacterium]